MDGQTDIHGKINVFPDLKWGRHQKMKPGLAPSPILQTHTNSFTVDHSQALCLVGHHLFILNDEVLVCLSVHVL